MFRKSGPHSILTTPESVAWEEVAPVVKGMNTLLPLLRAPSHAIRVFRPFFPDQPLDVTGRWVADFVLSSLQEYRHPNLVVELYNEVYSRLGKGLERYCEIGREAIEILHSYGIPVAFWSAASGAWEREDWMFLRSLGWLGADAIALHCYWANHGFTEWNALKFKGVWDGRFDPPILITECGRDRVSDAPRTEENPTGADGMGGWRKDSISPDRYLAELQSWDDTLRDLPMVLASTPFTAAPTEDWEAFGLDTLIGRILSSGVGGPLPVPWQNKYSNGGGVPDMPDVLDFASRWPQQYEQWKRDGGVPNVDFLGWMAATQGYKPTMEEFQMIVRSIGGNSQALMLLDAPESLPN